MSSPTPEAQELTPDERELAEAVTWMANYALSGPNRSMRRRCRIVVARLAELAGNAQDAQPAPTREAVEALRALVDKWRTQASRTTDPRKALMLTQHADDIDAVLALYGGERAQPHPSVSAALDALESGASHEQRRAAWNDLRDAFYPLGGGEQQQASTPKVCATCAANDGPKWDKCEEDIARPYENRDTFGCTLWRSIEQASTETKP